MIRKKEEYIFMHTSKTIFIRADANSQIASGHIMRCLTIAGALRRKDHQVTFLISDSDSETALTLRLFYVFKAITGIWRRNFPYSSPF